MFYRSECCCLLLMLLLSLCVYPSVQEQIGPFEIVTPVRVNEAGAKFPTSVHFKRKRRSLDESTGNTTDHWASANIHYRISAFGQNYHLNLTLDSGFIAPLYTVTILGVPGGDNLTGLAADGEEEEGEEEDTELRHCFYKGHVNAQAEHAAVISLCSGLVSLFVFFTHGDREHIAALAERVRTFLACVWRRWGLPSQSD